MPGSASPEFPPDFDEGQIQDLQIALAAHAQTHRYRFAVLDAGGERANMRQVLQWRGVMPETSFAAMYYPWILVDDPLRLTGLVRVIPPSGHVAGMYARSDRRRGVHKPPMNEVLETVGNVAMPIDDLDHGLLNDKSINAIRVAPGRGVRVMGSRTLWGDIVLRYVNVRRLLSMIERALEQSLQWTVFEPSTHLLYREIDRVVRSFLEGLFRAGVLDGATSEEAYFVRCDEETNPVSEVEQGRVNCHIGIQPPYPAEFVVVTIGITKDGIQVREGREQNV
jgi:phage tail sheath protein FI